MFPNPASDEISFVFSNVIGSNLEIYSIDGRLMYSNNIGVSLKAEVDISSFDSGLYIVQYSSYGQRVTEKFVKH